MKKYKKKIVFYKLLKILTFLLIIVALFFIFLRVFINLTISNVIINEKYEIKEPLSFLLIGSDYRTGKTNIDGARADTMIVVTVNPSNSRGNVEFEAVSIPRDIIVNIPCAPYEDTYEKINSSFNYGLGDGDGSKSEDLDNAITCTQNTVEDLLNIDINYYVMASFDAVINIVDAIGGIDVNSIQDICVEDADGNGFSTTGDCLEDSLFIGEGYQHLDGEHALGYARSRYGLNNSDYERNMRQQQVIGAIAKKILDDPISYGNDFIKVFKEDCETNIEINDIWTYINFASSLYNNININLANNIPVYIDNKSSIYQNITSSQISNDTNSMIDSINISELYGEDKTEDFEKYTYVSRHILTKEMFKSPTNLNNDLTVINGNGDNKELNEITIEFSAYSMYATDFYSGGYYSYVDQDTLYYTSNLLRKSLNEKVEDITYDYDMLSTLYYVSVLRNPLYAEYEGISQPESGLYDPNYNYPVEDNGIYDTGVYEDGSYFDGSNSSIDGGGDIYYPDETEETTTEDNTTDWDDTVDGDGSDEIITDNNDSTEIEGW